MVTLNNVYAIDIDTLVKWMKENDSVKNNEELNSIMLRMEHDLHWIKLGKYNQIESVPNE